MLSFARHVLGTKNIIIVFTSVGADAHIGPDRYGLTVGGQEDNRTVPLSPSPALALAHEMGHAYQDLCGMYDYINDKNLTVIQKKTIMERINVDLFENPIALELGEPLLGSDRTFSTWCAVQNSTYHRNVIKRPFWYYFLPWNLAKPS